MIFVTLGSQKFQFNRILMEIDQLIEDKYLTENVFAQTGYSDYEPKHYKYKNFLYFLYFSYFFFFSFCYVLFISLSFVWILLTILPPSLSVLPASAPD